MSNSIPIAVIIHNCENESDICTLAHDVDYSNIDNIDNIITLSKTDFFARNITIINNERNNTENNEQNNENNNSRNNDQHIIIMNRNRYNHICFKFSLFCCIIISILLFMIIIIYFSVKNYYF